MLLVIFVGTSRLLPDPLGGPVIGDPVFDKAAYGQAVGQLMASFVDTNTNLSLALFVVVGFALMQDREHRRAPASWKAVAASAFLPATALSIYFGSKAKLGLMVQLQFDRVSIERLEPALAWQSGLLLCASVAAFGLAYLCVRPAAPQRLPPPRDEC